MKIGCPCGAEMDVPPSRADRTKYCSNVCKYKYRIRPTGLTYVILNDNPGWFQPGHEAPEGSAHPNWKSDDVGYRQLHDWVKANREKTGRCEHCGIECNTQWANKSHEYKRDLADWLELCRKCHGEHDSGPKRGLATAKYGSAVQEGR